LMEELDFYCIIHSKAQGIFTAHHHGQRSTTVKVRHACN
jgi:hypothetical protein